MSTILNVRIDKNDKLYADKICKDLGLTLSAAVNSFIKAMIRNNGIPFEMTRNVPNDETIEAMLEGESIANDSNIKGYKSIKALKAALEA